MESEQIKKLEDELDRICEKPGAVIAKWYYSLSDEEKDWADANFTLFVPYSRRARADRLRRQVARRIKERELFWEELKSRLLSSKRYIGSRQKVIARAEKLLPMFKTRLPDPISYEASHELFFGTGWNVCLEEAAKNGGIPIKEKTKSPDNNVVKAAVEGWNAARKELRKRFPVFISKII